MGRILDGTIMLLIGQAVLETSPMLIDCATP